MVLTKQGTLEVTEEDVTSGSSKDVSCFSVTTVGEDGIKTMLKVFNCLVQKRIICRTWFKQEVG